MSNGSNESKPKRTVQGQMARSGGRYMKHPNTRALFDYWLEVKGDRLTPYRSELDPRAISQLLDSTFILENLGDGNVRFRLAGTRLCDKFGMELSGMSALAPWIENSRAEMRLLLDRVVAEPCVAQVACTATTRAGFLIEAEFAFMPIRSDFGDVSRILGCAYDLEPKGRITSLGEPPRFAIDSITFLPVDPGMNVDISDSNAPLPGFGEPGSGFSGKPVGAQPALRAIEGGGESKIEPRDRSHLKIVKSD